MSEPGREKVVQAADEIMHAVHQCEAATRVLEDAKDMLDDAHGAFVRTLCEQARHYDRGRHQASAERCAAKIYEHLVHERAYDRAAVLAGAVQDILIEGPSEAWRTRADAARKHGTKR